MSTPYLDASGTLLGTLWDPDKFHCYSCVKAVTEIATGVVLPEIFVNGRMTINNSLTIKDRVKSNDWLEIENPKPGDIALMGKRRMAYHVGIYLEDGYVCHCDSSISGVMIQPLKFITTIYGWNIINNVRFNND